MIGSLVSPSSLRDADLLHRPDPSVAVVVPCFKVKGEVLSVLRSIGRDVHAIYCVDDACPEGSGKLIEQEARDPRLKVLFHKKNRGVGGAVLTGYRAALADGHDILVKVDGDGQMDPALIGQFVHPIVTGRADYTKGNRFFYLENARGMPLKRLIGNSVLSFLTKLSSGYWNIFDPTNGYTAIHRSLAERIIERKIDQRYFFESDMLLNLYLLRAVVQDVPMAAIYGGEKSGLQVRKVVFPFFVKNLRNMWRRFYVHYLIRDFSLATVEVIIGLILLAFGVITGCLFWFRSITEGQAATPGQVMISALPILSGTQFILSALNFDMRNVPTRPRQHSLEAINSLNNTAT